MWKNQDGEKSKNGEKSKVESKEGKNSLKHNFKLTEARNLKAMTVHAINPPKITRKVFVCENCKMKTMDDKPYLNQECKPVNYNKTNSSNSSYGSFGSFAIL